MFISLSSKAWFTLVFLGQSRIRALGFGWNRNGPWQCKYSYSLWIWVREWDIHFFLSFRKAACWIIWFPRKREKNSKLSERKRASLPKTGIRQPVIDTTGLKSWTKWFLEVIKVTTPSLDHGYQKQAGPIFWWSLLLQRALRSSTPLLARFVPHR